MFIGRDIGYAVFDLSFDITLFSKIVEQSSAIWAYRKINSLYNGFCCQLSDGSSTENIGWAPEDQDTGIVWIDGYHAADAIASGKTIQSVWYDQIGSIDLTPRSLISNAPILDLNATPESRPATFFSATGTNALIDNSNTGELTDLFSNGGMMAFTFAFLDASANSHIWSKGANNYLKYHNATTMRQYNPRATTSGIFERTGLNVSANAWNSMVIKYNESSTGNVPTWAINEESVVPCSTVTAPVGAKATDAAEKFAIGNREPGQNGGMGGFISEMILWKDFV